MIKLTDIITMLTEQVNLSDIPKPEPSDRLGSGGDFERQQRALGGISQYDSYLAKAKKAKAEEIAFDNNWKNKRMDYVDTTKCYCGKAPIDQTSNVGGPKHFYVCDIKRKLEKHGFKCIGTRTNQPSPYNGPTFNSLKFQGTSTYKNIIIQVNTSPVTGKNNSGKYINYPTGFYMVGYLKDKNELGVNREYALELIQDQLRAGVREEDIRAPEFGMGYVDPVFHIDRNNIGNSLKKLQNGLDRFVYKAEIDKKTIEQEITARLLRKAILKKIKDNEYQDLISRGTINPITSKHYTPEEVKNGDREKYSKFKFGQDYTLEIVPGPKENDGLPAVKITVFKSAMMKNQSIAKNAAVDKSGYIYKMGYIQDLKPHNHDLYSIAVHFATPRPDYFVANEGDLVYIINGWPGSSNKPYKITGTWEDSSGKLGAVYINSPSYFKKHKKGLSFDRAIKNRKYQNIATIEIEPQITPYKARPGAPKF